MDVLYVLPVSWTLEPTRRGAPAADSTPLAGSESMARTSLPPCPPSTSVPVTASGTEFSSGTSNVADAWEKKRRLLGPAWIGTLRTLEGTPQASTLWRSKEPRFPAAVSVRFTVMDVCHRSDTVRSEVATSDRGSRQRHGDAIRRSLVESRDGHDVGVEVA